jgi:hypothetical protein
MENLGKIFYIQVTNNSCTIGTMRFHFRDASTFFSFQNNTKRLRTKFLPIPFSLQHRSIFNSGFLGSLAAVLQPLLLVMLLIYINNRSRKMCFELNLCINQQGY